MSEHQACRTVGLMSKVNGILKFMKIMHTHCCSTAAFFTVVVVLLASCAPLPVRHCNELEMNIFPRAKPTSVMVVPVVQKAATAATAMPYIRAIVSTPLK